MIKQFLTGMAFVAIAGGNPAAAADIPAKAPRTAVACTANWFQGSYIGVNAGSTYWTANRTDQDELLVDTATIVLKDWGGVVGGQIGYNWTTCHTLWGIEIDGNWAFANKATMQLVPNTPLLKIHITTSWDALVTARTRAGLVFDRMLLYVTGGLAAGHFKTAYTSQFLGIPGVIAGFTNQADSNQWRWGFVAGFGTEWAWTDRISLRSEVLYVEFLEKEKRLLFASPAIFGNFTESNSIWIARFALNYKFGAPGF